MRQKASAMMFIELMFWKNASVAESVRDGYNWRVSFCCSALLSWSGRQLMSDNLSMLSVVGSMTLCNIARRNFNCVP